MEPTAPVTRKSRKRAHSTKCPCCSEDRGKPEKETRRRRREDSDLQSSGPVVENKRSSNLKTTRVCKKGGSKLNQADKHDSENGDREEGRANEGRVLRSGRSTPVSSEIEKDKVKVVSQLKKSCKGIKKRIFIAQKGSKHTKPTNNVAKKHPENSMLEQNLVKFTPAAKKFCDNQDRGNMQIVSTKVKMSRRQNQSGKSKSFMLQTDEEDSLFSRLNQSSNQVENGTEKIKRDIPGKSNIKPFRKKPLHLPPGSKQSVVKKTLAIEKLKIRAFDDLKEKLEIALSQSPLTVPECVELLKKITSTNLRDILESKAPVMEERATAELKTSEDFEMTDSESETSSLEKEMVENMNESEAAEALVSFKVQTTVVNTTSSSSQNHSRMSSSFQEQSNSKKQAVNMQYQESITSPTTLQNLNIMVTSRAGLPSLSSSNQPVKKTEIPTSTSVVIPPVLPSVSIVQAPVTFQLLHVPSQVTKPSLSGDLTTAHLQQTPGFLYQNPPTVVNKLTPTSVSQQPNSIFPPALNNFLYLAKLKSQCEQKPLLDSNSPGLLPGIQTQEHILPSSSFPPACHLTAGTSLVNSTVTTLSSVSTSTTEVQSSTKLRPILPREPLVSKNLPLFGQGVKPSTGSNTLPKIADQSSIVKKAVKRLVNERTKTNDSVRPEVSTLPDIATSFRKSTFTPYNRSESHEREGHLGSKLEQQDVTEMTSKEQAIKALLSIGGNESISQQGNGEHLGVSSKTQETNKTSGLKVVFETDKGIFKVDDVTIDPQVNTIGKESYTCGKCGKIFTSLSYLARHIKRVCPDMSHRKWKCNHCDKAFRHPFGLQQHVYTHTGERPHKCPLCPKAFYSSNDLRRHSRIHSGERPYKCNHCGKSFATTISLKTHTFIHTGEKPHRCPHCTKTFATSSKLGRHIVTHSEQRPFSCVHCPKTFNRSGDLRRHNLHVHDGKVTGIADNSHDGQHEEKIYRCMECDGSFNTPRELEIHINEHTI